MAELKMHATLVDGIVKNRDTPITIVIDAPDNAKDVAIGLFELDEWTQGQDTVMEPGNSGLLDIIAIFKGDIVNKKFIVDWNRARQGTGTYAIKVRFDGDTNTYRCHISEDPGEHEGDTLEIGLGMSCVIAGKKIGYSSKSPLFMRNVKENSPNSVFFANFGDHYYTAARLYWNEPNPNRTIDTRYPANPRLVSLEDIIRVLPQNQNGPWDTVNIIAHGLKLADRTDGSNTDQCEVVAPLFNGYTLASEYGEITSYLLKKLRNPRVNTTPSSGLSITSISPSGGFNNRSVQITDLKGSGFMVGSTPLLRQTGQQDINGTNVTVVSSSKITCSFDLNGARAGLWDIWVTTPGNQSAVLRDGFSISVKAPD